MTNDELAILLANAIHEIHRVSSSIVNIQKVLVEVLEKRELTPADLIRLKELLSRHRSDAQSLWLDKAGQKVRGTFEKAQTAEMDSFFRAGLEFPKE